MTSGTFDGSVCILVKVVSLVFVLYNCDFGTFDGSMCILVKVVSLVFVLYNCDFWYL